MKKKLIIKESISQKAAIKEVMNSNVAIHFGSPEYPFAFSTKIFEYIATNIPVLSINYGGDINKLIDENNVGISINLKTDDHFHIQKMEKIVRFKRINNSYSKNYSYNELSKKLIYLINNEKNRKFT